MAKRILPLFIFDLDRKHGLGECDFIYCSDKDNGFVAKVDVMDESEYKGLKPDNINNRLYINEPMKTAAYINIIRDIGANPSDTQRRALLKKASELYKERITYKVNLDNIKIEDCIGFLKSLKKQGEERLANAGSNYLNKQTLIYSTSILRFIIDHLQNEIKVAE